MYQLERISLWTLVVLTLLLVIFKPASSGYVGQYSIFDLAEFNQVPSTFRTQLRTTWLKVTNALGTKLSSEYAVMTADQRVKFNDQLNTATQQIVTQINSIPLVTQAAIDGALNKTATPPPPPPAASASQKTASGTSHYAPFTN